MTNKKEKTKKYHHEVKLVKVNKIKPNEYNPNILGTPLMKQLVKRIKEGGFLQPILIRKLEKDKYEIIDGEHRFLAGKQAGYKKLPSIIVDKELPEAMISTINMNKIRGQFDTLELAEVVHELNKTYTLEELEDKLGYNQEQLTGMQDLLEFDFEKFDDTEIELEEQEPEEYKFEVILTKKQYDVIQNSIELTEKVDKAKAITTICLEYFKKHTK